MKQKISLILFLALSLQSQAQCSFETFFPFKFGFSKFESTKVIAGLTYIQEDRKINEINSFSNHWYKPDYLKGDSVFKSESYYKLLNKDCINGDENTLNLSFADDALYKIKIELAYSSSDFEKCMQTYNKLVSIFKTKFVDSQVFKSQNSAKEQIGEGFWFYPTIKSKRNNVKIKELSIGYAIQYEMKYNSYLKEWARTPNVEKYVIEIQYINLTPTKLTNQGY